MRLTREHEWTGPGSRRGRPAGFLACSTVTERWVAIFSVAKFYSDVSVRNRDRNLDVSGPVNRVARGPRWQLHREEIRASIVRFRSLPYRILGEVSPLRFRRWNPVRGVVLSHPRPESLREPPYAGGIKVNRSLSYLQGPTHSGPQAESAWSPDRRVIGNTLGRWRGGCSGLQCG